jgi:hypothetical protein
LYGFALVGRRQVGIPEGHGDGLVAQEFLHSPQIHSFIGICRASPCLLLGALVHLAVLFQVRSEHVFEEDRLPALVDFFGQKFAFTDLGGKPIGLRRYSHLAAYWRNPDTYRRQKEQKSRGTRQKNFLQLLQ